MPKTLTAPGGQRLVLEDMRWRDYEQMLRALDGRHLRITYDQGSLEIMTLSSEHERLKHLICLLIVALAEELGQALAGYGSWTMKRQLKKKGLEPDECFWVQNESLVRGKRKINLDRDPAPDLALEIDLTHSFLKRLDIYAALGVREIWRWRRGKLAVHILGSDGKYLVQGISLAFPAFRPAVIKKFLNLELVQGEMGMLRSFRNWVRENLAKNNGNPHK